MLFVFYYEAMLSTKLVSSSQLIILYPFHMFLNENQKMVLLFTIEERKNGNKVALVTNTKIMNRQKIGSSLKIRKWYYCLPSNKEKMEIKLL